MNEPQQPPIATSEHSGTGNEELSRRNDQLSPALSSVRLGTWDWDLIDHSMHWDERMHALFGLTPSTFSGRYEQFQECAAGQAKEPHQLHYRKATPGLLTPWLWIGLFHQFSIQIDIADRSLAFDREMLS